ncbi:MAG: hypothetical protein Q7S27_06010 [Nanoarchaeota archaeon]|nr:hypothetical protein [Nanoarchaeota archaeon]
MAKVPKQEQKLEQILAEQKVLEAEELNALLGKTVIFESIRTDEIVTGNLDKIGEHYFFMKNISYLANYSIRDYLNGNQSISNNTRAKRNYGIYNKADITNLHLMEE